MQEIAKQIKILLDEVESRLLMLDSKKTELKPAPDKWSKREILGHLIDSAANNHQRFVRAVYHAADQFPTYDQNEWVRIQHYNKASWPSLVTLFAAYNHQLCYVIEHIPPDAYSSPCNIGEEQPVQLDFVVKDYLRHLRHHLERILEGKMM